MFISKSFPEYVGNRVRFLPCRTGAWILRTFQAPRFLISEQCLISNLLWRHARPV
jgi:hypothetical protein